MGRGGARLVTGVVAALWMGWLVGCAGLAAPQSHALVALVHEAPVMRYERDTVPFFSQTPLHCGPAALATVLTDVGIPADPVALGERMFLPAREGTLQVELVAAARRSGAPAYVLPPELRSLLTEVAAGQAVVVLQNLGLSWAPRWHYAVVVGFDLSVPEIVLRSGVTRRELLPLSTFEHTWRRSGHWSMAVLPPGRLPVTVDRTRALEAAIGFERVAEGSAASAVYQAVLARWPDSLLAAMGLGNSLMAAGQWLQAKEAFQRAARYHDSAAAWNNLAQVHLKLGDLDSALDAAERARERAHAAQPQWLEAARSTLETVRRARAPLPSTR